jgi:hypothetical protein
VLGEDRYGEKKERNRNESALEGHAPRLGRRVPASESARPLTLPLPRSGGEVYEAFFIAGAARAIGFVSAKRNESSSVRSSICLPIGVDPREWPAFVS